MKLLGFFQMTQLLLSNSGSTNSAITVLPGYYLISASMLTGSGKSTIYSEKPIHINAGRITSIAMKPVTVAATDRLKSVQLGIDYGDSNEFKKLMHYYWGRSDAEASGFLSRLNFSCQNTTRDHNGSLKCGIDNYIEQPLRKIIDAHCVGNKVECLSQKYL